MLTAQWVMLKTMKGSDLFLPESQWFHSRFRSRPTGRWARYLVGGEEGEVQGCEGEVDNLQRDEGPASADSGLKKRSAPPNPQYLGWMFTTKALLARIRGRV